MSPTRGARRRSAPRPRSSNGILYRSTSSSSPPWRCGAGGPTSADGGRSARMPSSGSELLGDPIARRTRRAGVNPQRLSPISSGPPARPAGILLSAPSACSISTAPAGCAASWMRRSTRSTARRPRREDRPSAQGVGARRDLKLAAGYSRRGERSRAVEHGGLVGRGLRGRRIRAHRRSCGSEGRRVGA